MTPRKAPEAVLVALAEAACKLTFSEGSSMEKACTAYRAAVAPLRTRAEVDAEIIPLLRQHVARITGMDLPSKEQAQDFHLVWDSIKALCSEPTADETEALGDRKRVAALRTTAARNAELVEWILDSVATKRHINPTWGKVLRLCSEPTADETEPNATTDHGADPTLRWRKLVDELRQLLAEAYRGALSIEEKLRSIP